ncbi:hypothetical protein [Anatilimnocola floriformis]|uniref:hypothetical protein n=1 Tax=Anatilimnocola floriformis TaxID=2948575 RepID=UPI0020C32AEB|nr:hypothetical protein [Anatilimnocola floriformis]
MLPNIAGFFAGLFVAMALIAGIELGGFALLGELPEDLQSPDPQVMQAAVAKLPTIAFVMLIAAYTVGSFGGALVAGLICRSGRLVFPALIGALIWGSTLYWLLKIPSPLLVWFSLLTVPLATVAGALLALVLRPSPLPGIQPYDMRKKGMACK